jgi:hypothetical protein
MPKKKKKPKKKIVPRLGPPTNLRPAGAHEDKAAYKRRKSELEEREAETEGVEIERADSD